LYNIYKIVNAVLTTTLQFTDYTTHCEGSSFIVMFVGMPTSVLLQVIIIITSG